MRRSSEKESGYKSPRPSVLLRTKSCVAWSVIDGKVEVGIESQRCESLLMPYKGLRSRYELVALTFQSVKSDLNNEWMTRVANAKVKLEFPPGWSFRCQERQIWRII
jgi:hypothetical protein